MAGDNRTSYARIGFAVVLGVAAITAALIHIGGFGGAEQEFFAETFFRDPVSGLNEGSAVNFRGVKVGEVRGISFVGAVYDCAPEDGHAVLVTLAFDRKKIPHADARSPEQWIAGNIASGLHATVTPSGITGLSRLELNFPKVALPNVTLSWKPRVPCIPPAPSVFDDLQDTATRVMRQMQSMDFLLLYSNLLAVTESCAKLTAAADEIVDNGRDDIESTLQNVQQTSSAARELVEQLRDNPSLLLRARDPERLPETSGRHAD